MTLYAHTASSYRTITSSDQAMAGETVSDTLPQSILDNIAAAEQSRMTTADTLRERAYLSLVDLRAYRDLASPTNAQTVAAVKLLCRVAIGLVRLNLRRLDGVD